MPAYEEPPVLPGGSFLVQENPSDVGELAIGADIPLMAGSRGSGMNTGNQSQHGIQGNDGTAAVANEWQGQTDNRRNTDAHAYVAGHLEDQRSCRAIADHLTQIILRTVAHVNTPGNDQEQKDQRCDTAEETQFFADG